MNLREQLLQGKRAALFDMDGTLIDSMGIWKDVDIEFLGQRGIPMPEDLQKNIEGMSFSETAQYFKETFSLFVVVVFKGCLKCFQSFALFACNLFRNFHVNSYILVATADAVEIFDTFLS